MQLQSMVEINMAAPIAATEDASKTPKESNSAQDAFNSTLNTSDQNLALGDSGSTVPAAAVSEAFDVNLTSTQNEPAATAIYQASPTLIGALASKFSSCYFRSYLQYRHCF